MSILRFDDSTRALLTRTQTVANVTSTFLCDINGNALAPGAPPLPVYVDERTGDTYVQVADRIPTGPNPDDQARASQLVALNPVHYANSSGSINGWFIPAPSFTPVLAAAPNAQATFPTLAPASQGTN